MNGSAVRWEKKNRNKRNFQTYGVVQSVSYLVEEVEEMQNFHMDGAMEGYTL